MRYLLFLFSVFSLFSMGDFESFKKDLVAVQGASVEHGLDDLKNLAAEMNADRALSFATVASDLQKRVNTASQSDDAMKDLRDLEKELDVVQNEIADEDAIKFLENLAKEEEVKKQQKDKLQNMNVELPLVPNCCRSISRRSYPGYASGADCKGCGLEVRPAGVAKTKGAKKGSKNVLWGTREVAGQFPGRVIKAQPVVKDKRLEDLVSSIIY